MLEVGGVASSDEAGSDDRGVEGALASDVGWGAACGGDGREEAGCLEGWVLAGAPELTMVALSNLVTKPTAQCGSVMLREQPIGLRIGAAR